MKSILLLGSNGFIGKNLYEYLSLEKSKYIIYAPDSTKLDISDELAVETELNNKFYDVIIHSAVYNPRTDNLKKENSELEKNLRMFYNFEKNQHLFGKMIYFGSGAEYDKRKTIVNISETDFDKSIPGGIYGLYKYIIQKSIINSANIYNLRVFGLFGKYENWKQTFISGACCKAVKGIPITIKQDLYFDYLFIEDFCNIVKWFIDHTPSKKHYNIVSGSKIKLTEIAKIVLQVSKKELPIFIAYEGLGKEYTADNSRLLEEIGDFEFTSIYNAISKLYHWYENQKDEIDTYPLLYQNF